MRFIKLANGDYLNVDCVEMLEVIEDFEQEGLFDVVASHKMQAFSIYENLSEEEARKNLNVLIMALEA